jgi:hypothetical protein
MLAWPEMSTPRSPAPNARVSSAERREVTPPLLWLLAAPVVVLHFLLVISVARQPLGVNDVRGAYRSPIWAMHNDTIHRIGPGADFFAVYHAGRALRADLDPYTDVEEPRVTPYWFPYRYLPVVGQTIGWLATLFAPRTAYLLWIAVLETSLWLLAFLLLRACAALWLRVLSLGALLLSSPYFLELHMGQFTFITCVLVAVAMLLLSRRHAAWGTRAAGAIAYASATLLKVFPVVCAPALVRHRRYLPALGLSAFLLLGTGLPYFIAHPAQWQAFSAMNLSQPRGTMSGGNFGFLYLVRLLTSDIGPGWQEEQWVSFTTTWRMLLLGGTALAVLLSRSSDATVGTAAMMLAHFVTYADVWEHHASGIIVIGLLLLWALDQREGDAPAGRRGAFISAGAAVVLLALPTPFALLDVAKDVSVWDVSRDWSNAASASVVVCKALPAAVLLAVALREVLRGGLGPPRRQPNA